MSPQPNSIKHLFFGVQTKVELWVIREKATRLGSHEEHRRTNTKRCHWFFGKLYQCPMAFNRIHVDVTIPIYVTDAIQVLRGIHVDNVQGIV